ncbi:hypothetical protein DPMN_128903 [Dreissena polymorpha]|uniref:Uncharacterized protein n=1 Tax=Dreissena polymorpha TaxID=45954 RepID=A0A9D4H1P9_DREPO|nr:hypothetical protein DPMN_128899 [Dreissena polymorpha]KAH3826973.1 hypothetical protein DPMN_128901 [Dreissena polymorpha]KAH3826975.1 hypothetical protein DPMN_128903 [Dreissena polymorpha]
MCRIVGECSHLLAVVLKLTDWILDDLTDVPSQPSSTSCPQQWDKPRGSKIKAEPVSTMVLSRYYTGSPENGGKFKYIMSIPRDKREVCSWKLCLYITSIRYPKMVFSRPE